MRVPPRHDGDLEAVCGAERTNLETTRRGRALQVGSTRRRHERGQAEHEDDEQRLPHVHDFAAGVEPTFAAVQGGATRTVHSERQGETRSDKIRAMASERDPIVVELFERTAAAQRSWVVGDASGYEELFSPDQLTIFGPFGGPPVRGRSPGAAQRVADLFNDGTSEIELIDAVVSTAGDLVCLVMIERCDVSFTGVEGRRRWDLRTTQIYRRAGEEWFIVHRHAEPLIQQRDLNETLALLDEPRS